MQQPLEQAHDLPAVVLADRRRRPERRASWRGGRRDTDWKARPPGVLGRVADYHARLTVWTGWLRGER